jgi:hypothetical protein
VTVAEAILARLCLLTTLVVAGAILVSCGTTEPPPIPGDPAYPVAITDLLARPMVYHQRGVLRFTGWCRIEFEGNSLYPSPETMSSRRDKEALWLNLGWPVSKELLALNGEHVVVEGRFNMHNKGHFGAYLGAIEDIRRIEAPSSNPPIAHQPHE